MRITMMRRRMILRMGMDDEEENDTEDGDG